MSKENSPKYGDASVYYLQTTMMPHDTYEAIRARELGYADDEAQTKIQGPSLLAGRVAIGATVELSVNRFGAEPSWHETTKPGEEIPLTRGRGPVASYRAYTTIRLDQDNAVVAGSTGNAGDALATIHAFKEAYPDAQEKLDTMGDVYLEKDLTAIERAIALEMAIRGMDSATTTALNLIRGASAASQT